MLFTFKFMDPIRDLPDSGQHPVQHQRQDKMRHSKVIGQLTKKKKGHLALKQRLFNNDTVLSFPHMEKHLVNRCGDLIGPLSNLQGPNSMWVGLFMRLGNQEVKSTWSHSIRSLHQRRFSSALTHLWANQLVSVIFQGKTSLIHVEGGRGKPQQTLALPQTP